MITTEAVRVPLPTPFGVFEVHAFERASGHVYVAMVLGDIGDGEDVLVRLHSECLTGDALGSLRCDCGIQLRLALRTIAAEQRGVLVYATGHEGRGIGLVNKLRAYVAQDDGADTVDANVVLGLPVDSRDYTESAAVLAELGVRSVRLLTNNPRKVDGLRSADAVVNMVIPLPTTPHHRNIGYLNTKADRMDHVRPTGLPPEVEHHVDTGPPIDAMTLLGHIRGAQVRTNTRRPHRDVDRRLQVDQRRGGTNGVACIARRMRHRVGRRRHGCSRRPGAHGADGVGSFAHAGRARHQPAHSTRGQDPRLGRGHHGDHHRAL
jgi:GTP cyclohydrolase II